MSFKGEERCIQDSEAHVHNYEQSLIHRKMERQNLKPKSQPQTPSHPQSQSHLPNRHRKNHNIQHNVRNHTTPHDPSHSRAVHCIVGEGSPISRKVGSTDKQESEKERHGPEDRHDDHEIGDLFKASGESEAEDALVEIDEAEACAA